MSEGNAPVTAVFKTSKGIILAGAIFAEPNCWSMLKGGLTADTSGAANLYFEVLPRFLDKEYFYLMKFSHNKFPNFS